jgi:uncharacterized protein YyaL (SSP411 family)
MSLQRIVIFILCLLPAAPLLADRNNQLANHASPYLAMHAQDPVQWQEWGQAAHQAAAQEDKLLFVSSGYFSCHWCHVMQRESFSNPEIAALLNKHFIPVKVDRELNPALDSKLISFVERTRGYAGWPLNVFITPDGYPLYGLVYMPPQDFKTMLLKLTTEWQQRRTELKQLAAQATNELATPQISNSHSLPANLGEEYTKYLLAHTFDLADELQGGFGQQNKFPMVPQLQVLLAEYQRNKFERLGDFLQTTLDHMASQGLNDQLGGGFYRYAVDPAWQIPHFEKMLYDNAQLAGLYLQAAAVFNEPHYQTIAFQTLDFMLHELATPTGGLAASLSAVDEQGVEGGYYLWRDAELAKVLSQDELAVVKKIWGIAGVPELEAGHHFRQVMTPKDAAKALNISLSRLQSEFDSAQKKLRQVRSQRRLPKDDKTIAAWNGLALSALAQAMTTPAGEKYRPAATRLRDYLVKALWDGQQLHRVMTKQGSIGQAGLEDYAYVSQGLLDWAEVSGRQQDRELAYAMIKQAWRLFYGKQGWQRTETMWLRYGVGETVLADGVMPAPSAVLIASSLSFNDESLEQQAVRALNVGDSEISVEPFWNATQIGVIRGYQETKTSTSLIGSESSTSKAN